VGKGAGGKAEGVSGWQTDRPKDAVFRDAPKEVELPDGRLGQGKMIIHFF